VEREIPLCHWSDAFEDYEDKIFYFINLPYLEIIIIFTCQGERVGAQWVKHRALFIQWHDR
jgi:hypothetical protein